MKIRVVNKKFSKCDGEYIGRPSILGSPFKVGDEGLRNEVIELYREWLRIMIEEQDKFVLAELKRLAEIAKSEEGLTLVCWCKPLLCHGNVIKEVLLERYGE